jgi:hypothetical protein
LSWMEAWCLPVSRLVAGWLIGRRRELGFACFATRFAAN